MNDSEKFVKDYTENLLTFFGLNVEVATQTNGTIINAAVPSTEMNGFLIGEHGNNLRAIQSLVRSALVNQNLEISRVSVDVADYKKQQAERLTEEALTWIEEVIKSGEPKSLQPMNPADRRTVHQAVTDADGVISESAGMGRERHVIIKVI